MEPILFRQIQESDFDQIKALHEDFFPVRYADSFYVDSCKGLGVHGAPLFTSIAVGNSGNIVGFIFAQFIHVDECEHVLLDRNCSVSEVCYILTLGLKQSHRRTGLGSQLVANCISHAKQNQECGAVYLHVIHYNISAIKFYEKNNFEFFEKLTGFYTIDKVDYTAYLFVIYINGSYGPLWHRLMHTARSVAVNGVTAVVNWLASLVSSPTNSKRLEMGVNERSTNHGLAVSHGKNTSIPLLARSEDTEGIHVMGGTISHSSSIDVESQASTEDM